MRPFAYPRPLTGNAYIPDDVPGLSAVLGNRASDPRQLILGYVGLTGRRAISYISNS